MTTNGSAFRLIEMVTCNPVYFVFVFSPIQPWLSATISHIHKLKYEKVECDWHHKMYAHFQQATECKWLTTKKRRIIFNNSSLPISYWYQIELSVHMPCMVHLVLATINCADRIVFRSVAKMHFCRYTTWALLFWSTTSTLPGQMTLLPGPSLQLAPGCH